MIDRLSASDEDGNFCLDSAYPDGHLARLLCDEVVNLGQIPRILPKYNTPAGTATVRSGRHDLDTQGHLE